MSKPIRRFRFTDCRTAYDACQTREAIKQGDVLIIESFESAADRLLTVIGLADAWPVAVTAANDGLHTLAAGTSPEPYFSAECVAAAVAECESRGLPLAAEFLPYATKR